MLEDDWETPVARKLDALADAVVLATDFTAGADGGHNTVAETGQAEIVLRLSAAPVEEVLVAWRTTDGTATAGEDYEADAGVVRFAPGETQKTVTVTVLGDATFEGDEQFSLVVDDASGAELVTAEVLVTILDDDQPGGEPEPAEPEPAEPPAAESPRAAPEGRDAVLVDVDIQRSQWWYQVDVTLTNTADRFIADWTLALVGLLQIDQLWNAEVVDIEGDSTFFQSNQTWSQELAPGQTVGFGLGGSPTDPRIDALDETILAELAVFDGLLA